MILFSRLLSKNVKIKIYKIITLPFVLYGCGTWSVTLREEHGMRLFENRVLRMFAAERGKWREAGEDCILRSVIT
jgi:hypothetical protein